MTLDLRPPAAGPRIGSSPPPQRVTLADVMVRRLLGLVLLTGPVGWAVLRAGSEPTELVNPEGLRLVGHLLRSVAHPATSPDFLARVLSATAVTVVFAALGTAGALVIGAFGGLVLSDVAWRRRPPGPVRALRVLLRAVLVAIRSLHELVWALLFVSVLGLDPLVAVLAIAVPFGAQTAKVFAEILDGVPTGPLVALRAAGAGPVPTWAYALLPAAGQMLASYAFYRLECAIRSVAVLGVVGVGGLGQELVVSLSARNWGEVWTLIAAVLLLSAAADLWSSRLRTQPAVASCSARSSGRTGVDARGRRHRLRRGRGGEGRDPGRWPWASTALVVLGLAVAWVASGASWSGLWSSRSRDLTARLLDDLWPPHPPPGGWPGLWDAALDTVAMAVLAIAVAVAVTLVVGPWAARPRPAPSDEGPGRRPPVNRAVVRLLARAVLLVLRSIPPTVWAVVALLAFLPGILPGAVALGLYTGGILGRLVAEAWESGSTRARDALLASGVPRGLAALAATIPPSAHHLVSYTLYRLEVCVRDTAVVGVVGAAGLGRLLAENLAVFRFPAVTTILAASFGLSVAAELAGRRVRRSLRR